MKKFVMYSSAITLLALTAITTGACSSDDDIPATPVGDISPTLDSDGDGVVNITEISIGTDPYNGCDFTTQDQDRELIDDDWKSGDCDNDGLENGIELDLDIDPLDRDSDDDGIDDKKEIDWELDPNDEDSDDDGILDGDDDFDNDGTPDRDDDHDDRDDRGEKL
ncbi:hypothetical protein HN014_16045 [Aquimarina sp. TRL1]|uniref:hypothetical protein n=1 Tax=Aquimarina sp. (strain TRL1) TaxID=2736252 RepID=UPI00158B73F6|nr:hypothetical protein [Aquimarina sp. TRL1]QKX06360.1 hypothetical protein HN014_16045 [Aquimarina sp. TRL1]